jgi:hypothetical protein
MPQTVAAFDSPLSLRLGCVLGFRRVYAESMPSLRLGLCAWVLPSLCRVFAESLAGVVAWVPPSLRRVSSFSRIRDSFSRSSREWQPAVTSFLKSALDPAGATTSPFAQLTLYA